MIDITCPDCHRKLKVKDDLAGKRIRCPGCQQPVEIPVLARTSTASHQANLTDDATLAPSSPPPSVADEATLPPPSSQTVSWDKRDHSSHAPGKEVLTAGSAYEVEGEIARGGMGAIMRAIDQDIHREIAIKFLLNHADAGQKTRFIEEAQITGQLEHPNIVPIHQLGTHEDGRCFFSMKMVKGRSLADILKRQNEPESSATDDFTLGKLLTIFSNICNAMAYAHSRHVIHRDLKPANIMVGDFGEVYVMDWGLAKVLGKESGVRTQRSRIKKKDLESRIATARGVDGNLTQAGAIMGTPAYMPPEQATGEAVDQRSDIYSLGAILYEMLTLSPPVGRGGDSLAILMRVVEGDIKEPSERSPKRARQGLIPPELSAIAMKALSKDAEDRYESVEDLQHDIQLYQEGRSVSAKHDSAWELFKKLVKRNKGASIATLVALFVLAGVVSGAFYINYQERLEAEKARDQTKEALILAEASDQAFRKEQRDKEERTKASAPAFLMGAQLTAEQKQFDAALAQVNIALDNDPSLTAGYLLKGQLLLTLDRHAEAVAALQEYQTRNSEDSPSRKLLLLASKPRDDAPYLWEIARAFEKQKFLAGMAHMDEKFTRKMGPIKDRLPAYRKMIEKGKGWEGENLAKGLVIREGKLVFGAWNHRIRDLEPLKGIPINELNLRECGKIETLEPLRNMPLTRLHLFDCPPLVKTLEPLTGMKLTNLLLRTAGSFPDIVPLKDMPLETLVMHWPRIPDLDPLLGEPRKSLKSLDILSALQVRSIAPLKGMKLTRLLLDGCNKITDLGPIENMPLEFLNITNLYNVRDFTPLRTLSKVKVLVLNRTAIDDLALIKDMPLTELEISDCKKLSSLAPLQGKKLVKLNLSKCSQLTDPSPLQSMTTLKNLNISGTGIPDLKFAAGLQLDTLMMYDCPAAQDLARIARMELRVVGLSLKSIRKEDVDVLRGMKSLTEVHLLGFRNSYKAGDFFKAYDEGKLK